MMIVYQAVKNTCNAAKETSGFCFYKSTNGIKRHLGVDTLGLPFFTHCTAANISDDQGLVEMLTANINYFKSKPMNVPKITILLDNGYHLDKIITALTKVYPQIMRKIKIQLSPKPSKKEKAEKGSIPIIRADGRPIKIRPENPGGRQYPHQDLVIYNSFRSDISEKETYLKKSPEKPLNLLTLTAEEKPKLIEDQSVQLITVSEDDISKTNYQAIDDVKKIITNSTAKPISKKQDIKKQISQYETEKC